MRIDITLNGNPYAIEIDGHNFIPCSVIIGAENDIYGNPSKNAGVLKDKELGYFTKLSNAALRLCREEIASSTDKVTLKEFAARIEALNKQLTDQLDAIAV